MPVRNTLLVLAMLPGAGGAVELIGMTVPPYPAGLQEVGGTCLSDSDDPAHVCDFSIGLLADPVDDPDLDPAFRYVIAGRMAGRDGPLALWKITDAHPYPKVGKGYFWQAGSCRVDKRSDTRVIAVVRQGDELEYLADVAWARRLDLQSGKFSVLEPARVDCVNEGFGEH